MEGIGSAAGPIFSAWTSFDSWRLLCHQDRLDQIDFRILYSDVHDCLGPVYSSLPEAARGILTVGPNPAHGKMYLSFRSAPRPTGEFTLLNTSGQVVRRFQPGGSSVEIDLDISEQPAGLYLLRYTDPDGPRWESKVIKE